MKKVLLIVLILTVSGSHLMAQKVPGVLRGTLQDSVTAQPLTDATVSVMNAKDSTLISFTLTSNSGYFEIKNIPAGFYYIIISYVGFETLKRPFSISSDKPVANLSIVKVGRQYKKMQEVVVKDNAPVKIKGDTLAFNTEYFRTKPNATVEDLLKKLPGVQVEKDGTIKTGGENVQKVYVDGKEFFSNDPKLATKNLTADMVDQVELFDDMSEQSRFNRIDDGSRSKAINLKLKKDKKKGVFGRAFAGYGTKERYDAGLTANLFKGATQVSVIARSNNTNNTGYTFSDMMGMFSGGGMNSFGSMGGGNISGGGGSIMMRGGAGGGMMAGGGSNPSSLNTGLGSTGITRSTSAGINYRDTWSRYFDVNGSYFYNQAATDNLRKAFRQTFFPDSTINSNQQTYAQNINSNHRINFNLIYSIDSLNSIIYAPNINLQNSERFSEDSSSLYATKNNSAYKINDTRTINDNIGEGVNWTNNLIWRRRFRRIGRTLSINFSNTYSRSNREGIVQSATSIYNESGAKIRDNSFNQQDLTNSKTDNYGITLSYTEPIDRNKVVEFNYGYNKNQNTSNRRTYNFNAGTGKYDVVNDLLSNHFQNKIESNRVGANYRVVNKKYNYQVGIAAQTTLLESYNLTKGTRLSEHYANLFPNASFNYQFARSRSLRFNYRGRTNQPALSQLQNVLDVSNPPYYRIGNPALRQEFINNVNLTYNFFNVTKFRNLFASVNFSNTYNKIVDSILQRGFGQQFGIPEGGGNQLIIPANMNGLYSVTGSFNFGFPIQRMKGGNFNATTRVNYNRNGNYTDGIKSYIKNITLGEDARLSYNYKESLDLSIGGSISYTSAEYTIQRNRNTSYYTHVYSADITYQFPKYFILSTDVDYTAYTGRSDGFNQSFIMWNASFSKQFLKNKRGELKLSVYDILNQNQSVTRNVGENYVEDVQNNVLQRFFMLSFTYNLNRMGNRNIQQAPSMNRGTRMR